MSERKSSAKSYQKCASLEPLDSSNPKESVDTSLIADDVSAIDGQWEDLSNDRSLLTSASSQQSREASHEWNATSSRRAASVAKPQPPRPASTPMRVASVPGKHTILEHDAGHAAGATSGALRNGPSEPSLSEYTQAYDQGELSRLLSAADGAFSDGPPALPVDIHSIPTTQPTVPSGGKGSASASRIGPMSCVTLSHEASARTPLHGGRDTILDSEESTTAYVRPSYLDPRQGTSSLGDPRHRITPIDALPSNDAEPRAAKGFGVMRAQPSMPARATIEPAQEERTSPAVKRESLAAKPMPRKYSTARLAAGAFAFGCAAITIVAWARPEWLDRYFGGGLVWHQPYWLRAQAARVRGKPFVSEVPAPRPQQFVELDIAVEPSEAQLFLDGRQTSNPLRISYPADGATHELRAVAPGYVDWTQHVKFADGGTIMLGLMLRPVAEANTKQH